MLTMSHCKKDLLVIRARLEPSTGRWTATSDDIEGLILEVGSIEELMREIDDVVPALLSMNCEENHSGLPIYVQAEYLTHVKPQQVA